MLCAKMQKKPNITQHIDDHSGSSYEVESFQGWLINPLDGMRIEDIPGLHLNTIKRFHEFGYNYVIQILGQLLIFDSHTDRFRFWLQNDIKAKSKECEIILNRLTVFSSAKHVVNVNGQGSWV